MRGALLALLLALFAAPSIADWQTRSWSRWEVDGATVEALFGIDRAELARLGLPEDPALLSAEIRATVSVSAQGADCLLAEAVPVQRAARELQVRLRLRCPHDVDTLQLGIRTLLAYSTNPMHYAAVRWRGGERRDALFTRGADTQAFATQARAPAPATRVVADYALLGFEHILAGADHVAFLLCMLLVSPRLGHRLWMITGFTLGHSLTLSLSVLGLLQADMVAVEALIGFTVALLAAEAFGHAAGSRAPTAVICAVALGSLAAVLAGRLPGLPVLTALALAVLGPAYLLLARRVSHRARLHLGMTAVFGLVHGLGFAAVLHALGLPEGQRGWALAGFNLGVEAGQLCLLLAFAGLLALARRLRAGAIERIAEHLLAIALCALGVFWFVGRSAA